MDALLTDEQSAAIRAEAEAACGHTDKWVSVTDPRSSTDACWGCVLDAYFHVTEEARHAEG